MRQVAAHYSLRRLSGSRDPDFAAAIQLYVTNITPEARTNSNEIAFWADHYAERFSDEFCLCCFYLDDRVIGFCELVYLKQEQIIVIDYLVLHRNYRASGEYFQFVKLLQKWIEEEEYEFDYVAGEVSFEVGGDVPSERSLLLVDLFRRLGFGVVNCTYYQPPLGLDNPQSDMRAHLVLASNGRISSVRRETLLKIVHAIYFLHYDRWYSAVLTNKETYRKCLVSRYAELERSTATKENIEVNGVHVAKELAASQPARRKSRRSKIILPLLAATFVWVFTMGILLLQHILGLTSRSLVIAAGASLIIFIAVFALFEKQGTAVLQRLLDFIVKFFGKRR
jgi:hypothetical protein